MILILFDNDLAEGKSDIITVATELPLEQYVIEWKLDGETFEKNNNKITFTENKGYKQSYFVEAIARDRFSGYIKYYGNTTIVKLHIATAENHI